LGALTIDEEGYVRRSAIYALGWIGSEKAIEPLIEALATDKESSTRANVGEKSDGFGYSNHSINVSNLLSFFLWSTH
jgi:hypothetical protein